MNLDPGKFKTDESRSNPMVVALQHADCPVNEICVYLAVGFGSIVKQCEHFKSEEGRDTAECTHEKSS
jgi:hypothetical protein